MTSPLGECVLLVPDADAAAPDLLGELEDELTRRGVAHRRARAADVTAELRGGARYLVHCGGQRSLVEVAPAVVEAGEDVVLGLFPGKAPNDFARTFGLTLNPRAAAILLSGDRLLRVDVGVADLGGRTRYVLNDVVVGLGAAAARYADRLRAAGRPGALAAWWAALATYRPRHTDVDMTFAEWHDRCVQVRLSNGQYAYDGLHAAPLALPDDGAWDVQVWAGPKHLPFTLQPKMLHADHLPHEHVTTWRQKRAEVDADRPTPVAVDDRYVGTTPATFTLLPKALRLKI